MAHPQVDVRFDHTIIAARDKHESARFFAGIFGLPEPQAAGLFVVIHLSDGRVLDFAESSADFPGQHYAFLVSDDTFDAIMERIRERGIPYWADPHNHRPGEINASHRGRGVYFYDPAGHHLEAITARYSGYPSLR